VTAHEPLTVHSTGRFRNYPYLVSPPCTRFCKTCHWSGGDLGINCHTLMIGQFQHKSAAKTVVQKEKKEKDTIAQPNETPRPSHIYCAAPAMCCVIQAPNAFGFLVWINTDPGPKSVRGGDGALGQGRKHTSKPTN